MMTALRVLPGSRGVPTLVTIRQSELDDLRDELVATVAEDLDHAKRLASLVAGAMVAVAKGRSPANHLVELDALIQRMTYQRGAGLAALRVEEVCPDGETVRHIGCGAAA